jgi:hypothetical protein
MAKRITETQRLIGFAMNADESTLNAAIESLTAIKANRFPKGEKKPRKTRGDKQQSLPATDA